MMFHAAGTMTERWYERVWPRKSGDSDEHLVVRNDGLVAVREMEAALTLDPESKLMSISQSNEHNEGRCRCSTCP